MMKIIIKTIINSIPSMYYCAAYVWRLFLIRTTFIAITGSHGKTTAKDCLATILQESSSTIKTLGTRNSLQHDLLPKTILRVKPWHRFAVIELGAEKPGTMKKMIRLIKPDVSLILRIGNSHLKEFKSLENIAREKAELIKNMNPTKTAILNGDDLMVVAMSEKTSAKVVTFGTSHNFNIWTDNVSATWPNRLEFRLNSGRDSYYVRTQYVGSHWIPSAVGALAASKVCGVPMDEAVKRIESAEPYWARLQPILLPNGAIVIRDDWYGCLDTFKVAFKVLESAAAKRKLIVLCSRMSDTNKKTRDQAKYLGKGAALASDIAVFIGDYSVKAAKEAVSHGMRPENVYAFSNWFDAVGLLKAELCEEDLLLLKGRTSDHLSRIYLSLIGEVKCQLSQCWKMTLCDHCPNLGFNWTHDLDGLMASPLDMK